MPDAPAKPATKAKAAPEAPAKAPEPKEDPKVAIPKLIAQLSVEGLEQKEKRKIRMRLRKLGHFGGINRLGDGDDKPAPKPKAAPAAAAVAPAKTGGKRAAV